jgi:hypothetical protein
MPSKIGIWLDRSKAIVIRISDKKTDMYTLSSDIDDARHPRCGTEGHCTIIPERRLRQRKQEIVRKFYQKIIVTIRNAKSILILGPGIAKNELINEIDKLKFFRGRSIRLEPADRMSLSLFESTVRRYFGDPAHDSSAKTLMLGTLKS